MSEEKTEKCGAIKHGVVDLRCTEQRGHDEPQDDQPATWHQAVYTSRHVVKYPGAHHEIEVTETVNWEPVDHAAEAVRHMMAGRGRPKPLPPLGDESRRDAIDAQTLHDSPGADL